MTYLYIDQNNNQYGISASEIEYEPMEPSESSSGIYSGGEKIKLRLTPEAFKNISIQVDALLLTSEEYKSARSMRTAILSVTKGGKTKKGILNPSEARTKFEVLLKKTLH